MQLAVKQNDQGALARLNLEVVAENSPPLWTQDPIVLPPGACAGEPVTMNLAEFASDIEGDPLLFRKISGPAWIVIGANGVLSGTPSLADVGTFRVQVVATDGQGLSSQATLFGEIHEGCR